MNKSVWVVRKKREGEKGRENKKADITKRIKRREREREETNKRFWGTGKGNCINFLY